MPAETCSQNEQSITGQVFDFYCGSYSLYGSSYVRRCKTPAARTLPLRLSDLFASTTMKGVGKTSPQQRLCHGAV